MKIKTNKVDTLCAQEGYDPKNGESRVCPVYNSTTYYYESASKMADCFDLKSDGYFYSRLAHPNGTVLEKKVSALEGGKAGVACASGQSATLFTILNCCNQGDNVVASQAVYGGTFNLLKITLNRYGIETRFVDPRASKEEIEALIDEKTKLIFAETVANPAIIVLDFDKFAGIAKKHGIIFAVDNTLASPIMCRPLEHGANVVTHSTSKYIDGHAVALGGIVIDGGNFKFIGNHRYPLFNEPDESYHGLVYGNLDAPFATKIRAQLIRDLGAIMSPNSAFLTTLGCETLALRMRKTVDNASLVAHFLVNHPSVEWVHHPSLEKDENYALAQKYMPSGVTGMMSFGVKGGREAAVKFMEGLKLIGIETHVADLRSCCLHPASTTHRQLSDEDLIASGISDNLVRLSVGIEDSSDIIQDLAQALDNL